MSLIREIIELALANGLDPVAAVKDFLEEKDSRITWAEAERIVRRLTQPAADTGDDPVEAGA